MLTLPVLLVPLLLGSPAAGPGDGLRLQARLAHSTGAPLVGPAALVVRLYDVETGGTPLWSESLAVTALDGVVSAPLGLSTAFPAGAFDGGSRWLSLAVDGDAEMLPRVRVASVPYAERASSAAALAAGAALPADSVGAAEIQDGAVGTAELATKAVTAQKIAVGSVGSVHLQPDAVDGSSIADGSISAADLAAGAVTAAELAAGAVTGAAILDGSITVLELAIGAVNGSAVADGSLTGADVADGSIAGADLASGSVTGAKLAAGAVGSAALAPGSVTTAAILDGAIQTADLGLGSVASAALLDASISTADLANGAVTGSKLASGAVTSSAIATGAVGWAELASDAGSMSKVSGSNLGFAGSNLVLGGGTSAGKLNIRAAGSGSFPQLVLTETALNGFARIGFENDAAATHWHLAGRLGSLAADDRMNFFHSVEGDVLSLTGTGLVGINTSAPEADLHVRSEDALASVWVLPGSGSNVDSELLLGEDATGDFGMAWRYDGGANALELYGLAGTSTFGPHVVVERNSGIVTFGADVRVPALEITGGSDLVGAFGASEPCEPGTVVVVDPLDPLAVRPATEPYSRGVIGVVSGAGGVRPGLALRQAGVLDGAAQVAIAGRVYVSCTAEGGPIAPGDLLTSATLRGRAMRAGDQTRAFGAVIGKALSGLSEGEGLVLVLVNLQ